MSQDSTFFFSHMPENPIRGMLGATSIPSFQIKLHSWVYCIQIAKIKLNTPSWLSQESHDQKEAHICIGAHIHESAFPLRQTRSCNACRMFLPIWAEMLEVSNLAGAETGMLSASWAAWQYGVLILAWELCVHNSMSLVCMEGTQKLTPRKNVQRGSWLKEKKGYRKKETKLKN